MPGACIAETRITDTFSVTISCARDLYSELSILPHPRKACRVLRALRIVVSGIEFAASLRECRFRANLASIL